MKNVALAMPSSIGYCEAQIRDAVSMMDVKEDNHTYRIFQI